MPSKSDATMRASKLIPHRPADVSFTSTTVVSSSCTRSTPGVGVRVWGRVGWGGWVGGRGQRPMSRAVCGDQSARVRRGPTATGARGAGAETPPARHVTRARPASRCRQVQCRPGARDVTCTLLGGGRCGGRARACKCRATGDGRRARVGAGLGGVHTAVPPAAKQAGPRPPLHPEDTTHHTARTPAAHWHHDHEPRGARGLDRASLELAGMSSGNAAAA